MSTSQPRRLTSIKTSPASHHELRVLAFFQPNHFEPSQSPQPQCLAFRLSVKPFRAMSVITPSMLTPNLSNQYELSQSPQPRCLAFRLSQIISSRVSHHNLDADFQPFQFEPNHLGSHRNLGALTFFQSIQFEPHQPPYSRCSVLLPTKSSRAMSVTTTLVFWPFTFQPAQWSLRIWCPILHLPINLGNQFEPSQSPHTRYLAINLYKQLHSCWSPILSVSRFPAQSSIHSRAFQSVTSISVLTFQPIGSHQSEPRQLLQPQYLADSLSAVLSISSHDRHHLGVWLPAHSSTITMSHHSQPSIASSMSVYQPIALLSNKLLVSAVHLGIDSSAHSSTLT